MSERTKGSEQYKQEQNTRPSPENLPEHQYSREELITLSKSPASVRRPKCLEQAFDSEDGKWDPDRWYKAKFGLARVDSPLPSGDGREQRKMVDRDKDGKKRPSVNDPVERLKEEKDGIVLCPQRRSFGTGCHVQAPTLPYTRHLSLQEDSRSDRDRDREKDSRERQVRKIGSGRIQIDRENNRNFSNLRDSFDDRDHSRDHDRDRDFAWSREREHNWDRDGRDRERDRDLHNSDRDRRFDRSDRFRRTGERHLSEKDRRDREYHDRVNDRNTRRRNHKGEEREPEWFSGGPTSQTDIIELRGFEREEDNQREETDGKKPSPKIENRTRVGSSGDKSKSSESIPEAGISLSGHSSPKEQQMGHNEQLQQHHVPSHKHLVENATNTPQQNPRATPSNIFDFEEILNAILPLDENGIRHGSRFSRFFSGSGGSVLGSDTSLEDNLMPCDDSYSSHVVPSPTPMVGPMGAVQHTHLGMHQFQAQHGEHAKLHSFSIPHHLMSVPNSAGDNATIGKSSLPPSVTALFNSAALGGSSTHKWNPHLDCSVETQESSIFTNSSLSSNNSFSTQDAEAQLKAMLFGGSKESASSSGTASPASLPPGVQYKAKTVAELEADMHQNSPQKKGSPLSMAGGINSSVNPRDVTAFNKLLIMINAASEASQRTNQNEMKTAHIGYGMIPSHNEFNNAVLRNKEKQMQLLQQSLNIVQGPVQSSHGMPPQQLQHVLQSHIPPPLPHEHQPVPLSHQQAVYQQFQKQHQMMVNNPKQLADLIINPPSTPGLPQAVSTPQPNSVVKLRAHNGGSLVTADPIFSLIQQNPTIVMNPASPAPHMTTMLAPQQSAVPSTARVSSPLMFNQQPPLHLRAPSPIHAGQLSPRSLTLGTNLTPANAMSSPTGSRSPVLHRVLSPQELSAHAQAVMQSALIKKQLQDQNERYMKKQQESVFCLLCRTKSPNQPQISIVKPLPAAQPVLPPTPQPKWIKFQGASMDTFTPTSVLRKMHCDKVLEKEKQTSESKKEEEIEFMPSMHDQTTVDYPATTEGHCQEDGSGKSDKFVEDHSDMDPNMAAMINQQGNQVRHGQAGVLPGSLSQSMSVEEKMKLLALAEKPGYLSEMLDQSAKMAVDTAGPNQGRPIMKAEETSAEEGKPQQYLPTMQQQPYPALNHQQNPHSQSPNPQNHLLDPQNPPPNSPLSLLDQSGRLVTGSGTAISPSFSAAEQTGIAQYSSAQQNAINKLATGRAIIGSSSIQQQLHVPVAPPAQNMDMVRLLEQHHFQQYLQRLQQGPHCQGMVLPPPPVGTPIACLGPPPVAARIPLVGQPPNSTASATLMHQQFARANAINAQHNHMSHMMAMQHSNQQHLRMASLPPLHPVMAGVSAHLSPRSQTFESLSPAALSATIQRIASPHGALKMNGPYQPAPMMNGGGPKVDVTSGIQRWFSPDILKNQLPSMPPLPTQGSQVVTVDELERN